MHLPNLTCCVPASCTSEESVARTSVTQNEIEKARCPDRLHRLSYLLAPSNDVEKPFVTFKKHCEDFVVHEITKQEYRLWKERNEKIAEPFLEYLLRRKNKVLESEGSDLTRTPDSTLDDSCGKEIRIAQEVLAKYFSNETILEIELYAQEIRAEQKQKKRKRISDQTESNPIPHKNVMATCELQKAGRTKIHEAIRTLHPFLTSEFVSSVPSGIQLKPKSSEDRGRQWGKSQPQFLHFTLKKRNLDTMGALMLLSRKLRLPVKIFGVAGTKDKHAVTYQRVSAYRVPWSRIAGLNKTCPNIQMSDPTYEQEKIWLGALHGNYFEITLRDVSRNDVPRIYTQLEQVIARGFPNYYGPQRFGTTAIATFDVGRCLLKNQYDRAISLVLSSKALVAPEFGVLLTRTLTSVQNLSENTSEQYAEANVRSPRFCHIERALFEFLSREPRNYMGAWNSSVPRSQRMMYVHAAQSVLWNTYASERLRISRHHVLVGDLISTRSQLELSSMQEGEMDVEHDGVTTSNPSLGEEAQDSGATGNDRNPEVLGGIESMVEPKRRVGMDLASGIHIVKTDQEARWYTLADVVLPLPGPNITLFPHLDSQREVLLESNDTIHSNNSVSLNEARIRALAGDLDLAEIFSCERSSKDHNACGGYRHVVVVPFDVRVKKESLPEESPHLDTSPSSATICLQFGLSSGSYATSLLRELCEMNE